MNYLSVLQEIDNLWSKRMVAALGALGCTINSCYPPKLYCGKTYDEWSSEEERLKTRISLLKRKVSNEIMWQTLGYRETTIEPKIETEVKKKGWFS